MKFLKAVAVGAALVVSMSGPVFAQAKNMTAQEQANLKMVLDWWREVLQAGHMELAPKYMAEDYIQHSTAASGGRNRGSSIRDDAGLQNRHRSATGRN